MQYFRGVNAALTSLNRQFRLPSNCGKCGKKHAQSGFQGHAIFGLTGLHGTPGSVIVIERLLTNSTFATY